MVGIRSARPSADESTAPQAQTGAATVWTASGVVWTVVVVQAMVRWIGSDTEFAPAPVHRPDVIATANLVGLRIFEGTVRRRDRRAGVVLRCMSGCGPAFRG